MASVPLSTRFKNYHWQQFAVLPSFNTDNKLQFKEDNACVKNNKPLLLDLKHISTKQAKQRKFGIYFNGLYATHNFVLPN